MLMPKMKGLLKKFTLPDVFLSATTKTWTAIGIPAGLTFSTAGKFGGKATTVGTYNITFTLTDSAGRVTTKTLSLVVA